MCRSIKTLRKRTGVATDQEIRAAALQFVRKVTGLRDPSARHQEAFEAAVDEVAASSKRALRQIARSMARAEARSRSARA